MLSVLVNLAKKKPTESAAILLGWLLVLKVTVGCHGVAAYNTRALNEVKARVVSETQTKQNDSKQKLIHQKQQHQKKIGVSR